MVLALSLSASTVFHTRSWRSHVFPTPFSPSRLLLIGDSIPSSWRSLVFKMASLNGLRAFVAHGDTLVGVSSAKSRAGVCRVATGGDEVGRGVKDDGTGVLLPCGSSPMLM